MGKSSKNRLSLYQTNFPLELPVTVSVASLTKSYRQQKVDPTKNAMVRKHHVASAAALIDGGPDRLQLTHCTVGKYRFLLFHKKTFDLKRK